MKNTVSMQLIPGTCPLPFQPRQNYISSPFPPPAPPQATFPLFAIDLHTSRSGPSFSCQSLFLQDWIVFLVTRFLE